MPELTWLEKYRPASLDDVVGNREVVARLQMFVAGNGVLPHLLLLGPPGSGKTSSIFALAKQMLPPDKLHIAVLELNASDDRGLQLVRQKIRRFCQARVDLPRLQFKIVILDEADSMTPSAQHALQRALELYGRTCRFALACNDVTQIIEQLQSRCAILRYAPIANADMEKRLRHVLKQEGITACTDDGIRAVVASAAGDMRQALNNAQIAYESRGFITQEAVDAVVGTRLLDEAESALQACIKRDARSAVEIFSSLYEKGYCGDEMIAALQAAEARSVSLSGTDRLSFLLLLEEAKIRVSRCDAQLQMAGLASKLVQAFKTGSLPEASRSLNELQVSHTRISLARKTRDRR